MFYFVPIFVFKSKIFTYLLNGYSGTFKPLKQDEIPKNRDNCLYSNADTTQLSIWRACWKHSQFTTLQFTRKVWSVFIWTESLPYYVYSVHGLCIFWNKVHLGKDSSCPKCSGHHKKHEREREKKEIKIIKNVMKIQYRNDTYPAYSSWKKLVLNWTR